MKRLFIVAGLVLACLGSAAFGPPPPPTPRADRVYVNAAFPYVDTKSCAFPVEIKTIGYAIKHVLYYPNGAVKQTLIVQPTTRTTFTNLDNGKSVSTPSVGLSMTKYDTAGHMTLHTVSGLVRRIVVPGKGLVIADIGQVGFHLTFDAAGALVDWDPVSSGIQNGVTVDKLCQYLD